MKIRSQKADLEYLDVLNRLLAQAGGIIVKQRGLYCENLDRFATEAYGNITSDSERLFVNYISRAKIGNLSDEEECTDALYSLYKASTHKDVETGRTSVGPHRDELMIYIAKSADKRKILQSINSEYEKSEESADGNMSGFAARTFGSQGQQRSAVLAIKLAEGEIAKERCGEYPVFLLDDLFSELDSARRERLCRMLEQRQCIITACDKASFPIMNSVNIINVCGGKYKAE